MDQIPEPVKAAIEAGDAKQQPQIDSASSKAWIAIIGAVAAGVVSIAATVIPMVRPAPVSPDAVQKVFITNWPGTPGASGLTDAQKKSLEDIIKNSK